MRNEYLDQGISDNSDSESGYDSEAAEVTKARNVTEQPSSKRRKLSHSPSVSEEDIDSADDTKPELVSTEKEDSGPQSTKRLESVSQDEDQDEEEQEVDYRAKDTTTTQPHKSRKPKKAKTPGVIYLSSLPPYLKPSALRNILAQRGFEPITRLFLTPTSKHKHSSKKSSRQLYSEGWLEFASKKTARQCAEALNAQQVGGKKGGFYYDDLWNMKYLKGMAWDELMAGIREERREEEGRRDEARRKIAHETKAFVEGVERGKRLDGMKRKRTAKDGNRRADVDESQQRTWRQHEVARDHKKEDKIGGEVQQVLSKIF